MSQSSFFAVATALLVGAVSLPQPGHAQASRPGEPAAAAMSSAKLSRADKGALGDMAQANMAEVAMGQLALQKTQDAKVKEFAQMMIDDHTAGLKEVQQVAQAKGVDLPDGPSMAQKAEAKSLNSQSGAQFDHLYIAKAGLEDHRTVLNKLQKISKDAKDADVKKVATQMIPVVERHLKHAQGMGKDLTK